MTEQPSLDIQVLEFLAEITDPDGRVALPPGDISAYLDAHPRHVLNAILRLVDQGQAIDSQRTINFPFVTNPPKPRHKLYHISISGKFAAEMMKQESDPTDREPTGEIQADVETSLNRLISTALEGTRCSFEIRGIAIDRFPVFRLIAPDTIAGRRGRKALRAAGYRFGHWRGENVRNVFVGWH